MQTLQTYLTRVIDKNKGLMHRNHFFMQQLIETKVKQLQQPATPIFDPTLFQQLIQATNDQTTELKTAGTNQENKASKKIQKQCVSPMYCF